MKASAYRKRIEADLENWISEGWVPETSRTPILTSLPAQTRGDGRGWIAMAATVLAGLAVIAFIGDNWAAIPRGAKLIILILAVFASGTGSAFAYENSKKVSNALALLCSMIFAGSIALLGQAYNLPGEPTGALLFATIAAGLIGLAGRSAAAAFAALVFGAIYQFMAFGSDMVPWLSTGFWALHFVIACVALTAWLVRSRVLVHALLVIGIGLSLIHFVELSSVVFFQTPDFANSVFSRYNEREFSGLLFTLFTALWGGLTLLGAYGDRNDRHGARTLLGYASWACLAGIALLGIPMSADADFLHRFIWLGASFVALWYGAREHYGWMAGAGILSLITAISTIFVDLGMTLSVAALIFGLTAIVSLVIVYVLKRQSAATAEGDTSNA
ncbi:MAG: hypothetical protein CMK07_09935 [Ponticaulis sp.]|nr:hypothetical protein [Ponticaulis sp.]